MQNSNALVGDYIQTLRQKHKIKKSEYLSSGPIPVIDQGQDFIAGYINDTERAYDGQLPIIIFGDHTCTLKYVDFPFAVGADGTQLIHPTEDFDIRYFYYALQNLPLEHFGYQRHFKYLKTSTIFCPPISAQRKIAAVLSAYDDLIQNNTRRIKILEDMAQTHYREWFVHFRFPGHESVPMVESPLGPIPLGWKALKYSDVVDLSRKGINPSKFPDEIFAHFSIPAFDSDCMPVLDRGDSIRSSKYLITEDCVLVSKLNPHIPRVWLPFLNTEHRSITSTEFLTLKPKPPIDCVFLYNLCRSPEFTAELAVRALGTSHSHQRVKPNDFLGMSVLIPTDFLLNTFHEKVVSMINISNTLRLKNTNLRQTRDLLLPKLISGEIDVSELDIDTNGMQPVKSGTHIPYPLTDRLHADKKILGGKPVIKGTRLAVAFILDLLKQGWSEEEIVENYPSVAHEDIEACRAYQKR